MKAARLRVILALGTTQTLAWGSTFYLPAILAVPMAADLGWSPSLVFAAFSIGLVVTALFGPSSGHWIDRFGGRHVLVASSLVFAAGLALLALVPATPILGPAVLFLAWVIIGAGMAMGLYEAAFSALAGFYGREARGAITGITLIAGFASTICWPITAILDAELGWRLTCLFWAGMHLGLGLPLNLFGLPRPGSGHAIPHGDGDAPRTEETVTEESVIEGSGTEAAGGTREAPDRKPDRERDREQDPDRERGAPGRARPALTSREIVSDLRMWILAFVFTVTAFITTAMGAHLPQLLQTAGASPTAAIAAAALVGPAQVAGRLGEFLLMNRFHPILPARVAALGHPFGALVFWLFGVPSAAVFTILHGAGNGIMTIAKGTLPLAMYGSHGYGFRQGMLSAPPRILQAAAPFLFGLAIEGWGAGALFLSGGLGLMAFLALLALPARHDDACR